MAKISQEMFVAPEGGGQHLSSISLPSCGTEEEQTVTIISLGGNLDGKQKSSADSPL